VFVKDQYISVKYASSIFKKNGRRVKSKYDSRR